MNSSTSIKRFGLLTGIDSIADIVSFSLVDQFGKQVEIYRYANVASIVNSSHSIELAIVDVDSDGFDPTEFMANISGKKPLDFSVKRWLFLTRADGDLPKGLPAEFYELRISRDKMKDLLSKFLSGIAEGY